MSLFGDDGVEDLFNNANVDENRLPSDDEQERPFGEDDEGAEGGQSGEPIKVEPKKTRSVRNPRPRLTVDTLQGARGIHTIEDYFKDMKFLGKGHERKDLNEVMRRLQHWAHRMYPSYKFDDVVATIERLSKKKPLQVHMSKYRLGMIQPQIISENQGENEEDEVAEDEPFDEFDALLGEQIAISKLAPKTPSSSRPHSSMSGSSLTTPAFGRGANVMSTPYSGVFNLDESDLAQPLPPSQPSTPAREASPEPISEKPKLSSEQLARIAENRRLAMERLKAKKAQETF
ncbi:protein TIPIN homolog [Episyrphus balteatus]|uniref:protein TIPIN homolog n=1 Tax=Episyrphus balteatus TaxID=286459 RepID=UPI0024853972|nr:protein TIPIN homolog [Episyrphus balteatus]